MKNNNNLMQLMQNIYQLNLEDFKKIPINEVLKSHKTIEWLFYYKKNEIIKYCLENENYNKIIKEKKYISNYCVCIMLEKTNTELLDYMLENKYISKENILKNINSFFLGNNDMKYLPEIKLEQDIKLLGNKSIYFVNHNILNYAIKKGFDSSQLDVKNFLFCIKNHVDLVDKEHVLKTIEESFNMKIDIAILKEIEQDQQILQSNNQCMKQVLEIIFKNTEIGKLCQQYPKIILKMVNAEKNLGYDIIKNKILLHNTNDFSEQSLQKIKKYNKDFYRDIEKMKLYQNLLDDNNKDRKIFPIKKIKI